MTDHDSIALSGFRLARAIDWTRNVETVKVSFFLAIHLLTRYLAPKLETLGLEPVQKTGERAARAEHTCPIEHAACDFHDKRSINACPSHGNAA